ncbi:MAG TPA: hypothetical protein VE198_06085 [Actinoallomurus sp.]|jgi:hypothetical protein|nr:hypothetical protein [Actinoallomurus sp.]
MAPARETEQPLRIVRVIATHVLALAWAAGVPVRVNGRRGASPPTPTGLVRAVLDFLGHRSSSLYITNSRAQAERLVGEKNVQAHRVEVIPNGRLSVDECAARHEAAYRTLLR